MKNQEMQSITVYNPVSTAAFHPSTPPRAAAPASNRCPWRRRWCWRRRWPRWAAAAAAAWSSAAEGPAAIGRLGWVSELISGIKYESYNIIYEDVPKNEDTPNHPSHGWQVAKSMATWGTPPILGNLCLTPIWDDHSLVEIEWDV